MLESSAAGVQQQMLRVRSALWVASAAAASHAKTAFDVAHDDGYVGDWRRVLDEESRRSAAAAAASPAAARNADNLESRLRAIEHLVHSLATERLLSSAAQRSTVNEEEFRVLHDALLKTVEALGVGEAEKSPLIRALDKSVSAAEEKLVDKTK